MTNADKFKHLFGIYATELWAMPESDFLEWLNADAQDMPTRKWIPCSEPPKHHKDVIVRGIEAIGNVTVHKVMQWDVDKWRPTDYAPSITWKEWSEI